MGERRPFISDPKAFAWVSFQLNADSTLPVSCRRWLGMNVGQPFGALSRFVDGGPFEMNGPPAE
jgi:hypothetical protein